jgi:TRAP-type uncharacterized transport system substrate-binding protein
MTDEPPTADLLDLRIPASLRPDRPRAAALRSSLMLETAAALVQEPTWTARQARIQLREQGDATWSFGLFGSDSLADIQAVASGEVQFGIVNPATAGALAFVGAKPFDRPIPLRAIATEPSFDQLGIAVRADLGIDTIEQLVERQPAITVSVRGQADHSVLVYIEHVLGAVGASLADIEAWGGRVRRDPSLPHHPLRLGPLERGEIDGMFDEGIYNWADSAVAAGYRFLSIGDATMEALRFMGHRPAVLDRGRFPGLDRDVPTIDFSGFLVYTHADVADDVVAAFCRALATRADRIPWQGSGPLPLRRMVGDAVDAPLPIPFHPAAAATWRELDLLD